MIAAAMALAAGTVPVDAVVDSLRCDWRDVATAGSRAATGTLMLSLAADGAVPVEGEAQGGRVQAVPFRLDTAETPADCSPDSRLAAPALPLAGIAAGGAARGFFVLARLADGRVTAVAVDPAKVSKGMAQGFEVEVAAIRSDGLRVKRVTAVRRKRCVGKAGEQVCY